jgi:hypothetical protein
MLQEAWDVQAAIAAILNNSKLAASAVMTIPPPVYLYCSVRFFCVAFSFFFKALLILDGTRAHIQTNVDGTGRAVVQYTINIRKPTSASHTINIYTTQSSCSCSSDCIASSVLVSFSSNNNDLASSLFVPSVI